VFYLVFLFPVLMGLGGGAAMALAVKQGKVRNPTIAALFGALIPNQIIDASDRAFIIKGN
jgi:hypothetical protein